jgi:hypothetical protein
MFGILDGNKHHGIGCGVLDDSKERPTSSDPDKYEDPHIQDNIIPLPSIESPSLSPPPASYHVSNGTQMAETSTTIPDSVPVSRPTDDFTSAAGSAQESSDTTPPCVPEEWPPSDLRPKPGNLAEPGHSSHNLIYPQPSQVLGIGLDTEVGRSSAQGLSEKHTDGSPIPDLYSPITSAHLLLNVWSNPQPSFRQTQPPFEGYPLPEQQSLPPVASPSRRSFLYGDPDRYSEAILDDSSNAGGVGTTHGNAIYLPGSKSDANGDDRGKGKERMPNEMEGQDIHKAADREKPLAPFSEGTYAQMGDVRVALEDFETGRFTAAQNSLTIRTIMAEPSLVVVVLHPEYLLEGNLRADDYGKGKGKEMMGNLDVKGDPESVEETEEPPAQLQNETIVGREDNIVVTEDVELMYATAAGKDPILPPIGTEPLTINQQSQMETEDSESELSKMEDNESQVMSMPDGMVTMEDVVPDFSTTGGKFPSLRPISAEPVAVWPQSQVDIEEPEDDLCSMEDIGEPLSRMQESMATVEDVKVETSITTESAPTQEAIIAGPTVILIQNQLNSQYLEAYLHSMEDRKELLVRMRDDTASTTMEGVKTQDPRTAEEAIHAEAETADPSSPGQSPLAEELSALSQSPTDIQMLDLISQFSELAPQILNQSSMLESVIVMDDVSDQMATDNGGGGVADAVAVAARTAAVGAWCDALNGVDDEQREAD